MQRGERVVKIRCGADIKPLPITWLWPGWLPAGKLTILAGAAGTRKTTLALALAGVITTGGRWPDGRECKGGGNVMIWSSEDVADDTLVPRLIASGADLARCHFIEGIAQDGESVPFDPSQDIPDLRRAVDAIGGVSLLLIDPIVSAVAGDMHRANDVRRSLQAVVDFADAHGCAVIGITHFAKGGAGKAPQDRVIGSQAFGALARMVLVTAKEEGSNQRVMARAKSNIAPDDGGVAYSLELGTIAGGIEATHAVWAVPSRARRGKSWVTSSTTTARVAAGAWTQSSSCATCSPTGRCLHAKSRRMRTALAILGLQCGAHKRPLAGQQLREA